MNYQETTNDELYSMFLEHNEFAEIILYNRLKIIINSNLKKYNYLFKKLNIDKKDIYSEALFGVINGLNCYKQSKNTSINTFVNVCVKRRICKYLTKKNSYKNKINDEAMAINEEINNINYDNADPLNILLTNENLNESLIKAKEILSDFEYNVFLLKINGYKNKNIAIMLNKNLNQIVNANQRIKKKMQKL